MASDPVLPDQLAWQIDSSGWPLARLLVGDGRKLFWLSLAAPVLLYLAAMRPWTAWLLVVYLFAVAIFFARRLVAAGQEPDVRLLADRVAWRAPSGQWLEVPREKIEAFRIGLEEDTPELVLHFADGFRSWPLEIHPPAAPAEVRSFLAERLQVVERPYDPEDAPDPGHKIFARLLDAIESLDEAERDARLCTEVAADARRLEFFAAAHLDARTWRFDGTRASLLTLCRRWEEAAGKLRIAPEYAETERVDLGGAAVPLTLEADEEAWLSEGVICGPPAWLRALAEEALQGLESLDGQGKVAFEVPQTRWRMLWVAHDEGFDLAAYASANWSSIWAVSSSGKPTTFDSLPSSMRSQPSRS